MSIISGFTRHLFFSLSPSPSSLPSRERIKVSGSIRNYRRVHKHSFLSLRRERIMMMSITVFSFSRPKVQHKIHYTIYVICNTVYHFVIARSSSFCNCEVSPFLSLRGAKRRSNLLHFYPQY